MPDTQTQAIRIHEHGGPEVLLADHEDLPRAVRDLTGGEGVAAVYDGVGKDTFFASLYLTRPVLFDFIDTRERLLAACEELFGVLASGAVRVRVDQRYPLAEAAQAHRDLEARRTTGSSVLLP